MQTPWGPSQHTYLYGPGVTQASTAGHGGIHLTDRRNLAVNPVWRRADCWYEEDCDWSIVALTFSDLFSMEQLATAHRLAEEYYPEAYASVMPEGAAYHDLVEVDADTLDEIAEQLAGPVKAEEVTAEKLETMMAKARALLTKAESSTMQGERDAFAAGAARIMAKYGITKVMLTSDGGGSEAVGEWRVEVGAPYCYDRVALLQRLVDAYHGQLIYTQKDVQHSELLVYALPSDLERMQVLWPSLLRQMTTEMKWATANKPESVKAAVFCRSFMHGFAVAVSGRLTLAERAAAVAAQQERDAQFSTGKSVELVLADRKNQVAAHFKAKHPRAKAGRRQVRESTAGVNAGLSAGQRADLGHARVGA